MKVNAVEDKKPNSSDPVKKTDYDAKTSDNVTKYFTISDYNKFAGKILNTKIKKKGLVDKSDISRFIDIPDLYKKIATLAI